jgi:hypothetical protein
MSSFITGQRPLGTATEHCSWCIVGKSLLGNVHSAIASQRLVAVECLPRSRPFQTASISTSNPKSTDLRTPNAALIEPETYAQTTSSDIQIAYLQDLVSRLRQIKDYAAKVSPRPFLFGFTHVSPLIPSVFNPYFYSPSLIVFSYSP